MATLFAGQLCSGHRQSTLPGAWRMCTSSVCKPLPFSGYHFKVLPWSVTDAQWERLGVSSCRAWGENLPIISGKTLWMTRIPLQESRTSSSCWRCCWLLASTGIASTKKSHLTQGHSPFPGAAHIECPMAVGHLKAWSLYPLLGAAL